MNAYRFTIPLNRPLVLKGQTYTTRDGVLLERDGDWAEASPLPGFSSESVEDVIAALRDQSSDAEKNPASLAFALSALQTPIVGRLEVPLNLLLMGDRDRVLASAKSVTVSDCDAVKLKVGRGELAADIQLVRQVRELLPERVRLRLDANQAWELEQACRFADALEGVELEYIEEPLRDPNQLEELFARTGIRYALDETLLGTGSETLLEKWPHTAALICKPTLLGGRSAIESLMATGKLLVFSSAFESGIGIARIMQLAAEFSPEIPAGLDTLDWMTECLLLNSPQKNGGCLMLESCVVDAAKLERIEL